MSLLNKLSIYLLATTVIIFVAIGGIFMNYGTQREERLVSIYASLSMENFVDRVDYNFSKIEETLSLTASEARSSLNRESDIMPFVKKMVTTDSLIMGGCIAVVPDALPHLGKGQIMEYVSRDITGVWKEKHLGDSIYDYTTMPWYTDVVRTGKAQWSEPYFDDMGGDVLMLTYSYPLLDSEGKVIAVMTADVSIDDLTKEIHRLNPIDNGYAFIIDKDNIFITYPDKSKVLSEDIGSYAKEKGWKLVSVLDKEKFDGREDTFHLRADGDDLLFVYRPFGHSDWKICSVSPYSAIMSSLDLVTFKAIILLLVGLLILAVLIRIIMVYSMRPLGKLTAAAASISSGNLDVKLPEMKSSDEIGRLNNAFSGMQMSLREQMKRLVDTTKAKERIESELNIAKSIQMGLVPHTFSPFPECKGLELYAMLKSAREVGGDLYDFFIRDSKLFFTIGDVSGKGVPASLFMAVTRTLIRISANKSDSPKEIVATINDTIVKDNEECMFVTMFVGVLHLDTGELHFCNAGHNPPLITDSEGVRFMTGAENIPVGVLGGFEYKEESTCLNAGQTLLLYTDGLTEAENSEKELYGDERMIALLSKNADCSPKEMIERLKESVAEFTTGVDQSDDLTMLCLRLDLTPETIKTFAFENTMSSVGEIPAITDYLATRFCLDKETRDKINLIIEEALVNVINYAYPQGDSGKIELQIKHDALHDSLIFQISDSGKPFDPTAAADVDTRASLEDRQIGGLGIFLIQSLSDSVAYTRADGQNILSITISIPKS